MSWQRWLLALQHHAQNPTADAHNINPEVQEENRPISERATLRQVNAVLSPACSRARRWSVLFANEVRLLFVTLVTIIAALCFQATLQEFFLEFVKPALKPGIRILSMFLFAISLFILSIVIILGWKPLPVP